MKAAMYYRYGSPDVLQIKEVEKPVPKANEVLVKVAAASINSWDWDMIRGKPYIIRIWGLTKPKFKIPGADFAGVIEAIGKSVTKFKPGDEVLGDLCASGWGAYAEYVCAPENTLSIKPSSISFQDAAAFPQAGVMALQGIRDMAQTKHGDKVLINGAGGGVGTIAIQLAKMYGAEVTAVDSASKLEMLRSIGADHLIDYTKKDFTKQGKQYDTILDMVANRSILEYKRTLNPTGKFIMVGGTGSSIIQAMTLGPLLSANGKKTLGILAHEPNKNVNDLTKLCEEGKIKPVIDRNYPLDEIAEAFRYYGSGNVKGKIIFTS
jgi:NADPH:quinone reductase-like Zn-dependent oxidoreductase